MKFHLFISIFFFLLAYFCMVWYTTCMFVLILGGNSTGIYIVYTVDQVNITKAAMAMGQLLAYGSVLLGLPVAYGSVRLGLLGLLDQPVAYGSVQLCLPVLSICLFLFCNMIWGTFTVYIPYARHYNPWFIYFLPHFSVRFIIKRG